MRAFADVPVGRVGRGGAHCAPEGRGGEQPPHPQKNLINQNKEKARSALDAAPGHELFADFRTLGGKRGIFADEIGRTAV